jgi:hypothetical protein
MISQSNRAVLSRSECVQPIVQNRRGNSQRHWSFPIQAAMSRTTSSATWPGIWYSAGRLGPLPAMKRWFSAG